MQSPLVFCTLVTEPICPNLHVCRGLSVVPLCSNCALDSIKLVFFLRDLVKQGKNSLEKSHNLPHNGPFLPHNFP